MSDLSVSPDSLAGRWRRLDRVWLALGLLFLALPALAPGRALESLAFLVAGGVTSLPAAMAVFALVRRPVFLWYLAVALTGSLLVGFACQGVSLAWL